MLGSSAIAKHAVVIAAVCFAAACRQDMHDGPRYRPFRASVFFNDGSSARALVTNTVARGQLRDDEHLYTGRVNGQLATELPMPVTADLMARGQERFNVFCSPCHGRTAEGNGMVVQRGFRQPPSFHEDRLVNAPIGHFFDVMTNGFGAMQDYAAQVPVADRWAIAAYIRALQLSRHANVNDVPADRRGDLDSAPPAPAPRGQTPPGGAAPGAATPATPGAAPGTPGAAPGVPPGAGAPGGAGAPANAPPAPAGGRQGQENR